MSVKEPSLKLKKEKRINIRLDQQNGMAPFTRNEIWSLLLVLDNERFYDETVIEETEVIT